MCAMSSVSPNFRRPPRFSEATLLSSSTCDMARRCRGAGRWRYARAFATCKTRSNEVSLLQTIHSTDSYPYGKWLGTGFTYFSYPYGYDFALLFGSCKELPTFPTHMGRKRFCRKSLLYCSAARTAIAAVAYSVSHHIRNKHAWLSLEFLQTE
jgi:hypothetical protein